MILALLLLTAVAAHPSPRPVSYQRARIEYAEAMARHLCGSQHYEKMLCDWFRLQAKRERAIQEAGK